MTTGASASTPFGAPRYGAAVRALRRIPAVQYAWERRKNRQRVNFVRCHLPAGGVGAELGVHKGFFSDLLLQETAPEKLHLVDPWYLLGPRWEWSGGNPSTADALARIIRRFGDELASGKVEIHICDDIEFLSSLDDQQLDWAYVDSSHEYDHTVEELRALDRVVRRGGIIAGDDWHDDPRHRHGGIGRAVKEFIEQTGHDLVYANQADQQWAVRRSS